MFFELLQHGQTDAELVDEVAHFFKLDRKQVVSDLEQFQKSLTSPETHAFVAEEPYSYLPPEDFSQKSIQPVSAQPEQVRQFQIAKTLFDVCMPSSFDLAITDAVFAPLINRPDSQVSERVFIEFQEGDSAYLVKVEGKPEMAFTEPQMVGSFLISAMSGYLYRQMEFAAAFHAGAIRNLDGQAIMFAAPSGQGKSTLIVELSLNGFGYLGDDLTIVDLAKKRLQAIPTAANLKAGSWQFFEESLPEIKQLPVFYEETRPAKFLPIPVDENHIKASLPLKALVFPNFEPGSRGTLIRVEPEELLERLMRSGIYTNAELSEQLSHHFIDCFMSLPAVSITYPDTSTAIDLLQSEKLL